MKTFSLASYYRIQSGSTQKKKEVARGSILRPGQQLQRENVGRDGCHEGLEQF